MGVTSCGGGHTFVFGEVSVPQGAAGQVLGSEDCCTEELTWHSAEAQLQGWVQHQLTRPSVCSQENPTAASTLSLLSIPDLTQNTSNQFALQSHVSAALSCFQICSESTVRGKGDKFPIDNSYL